MNITNMTPEQKRVEIARACGWNIRSGAVDGSYCFYIGDKAVILKSFWWGNHSGSPTLEQMEHRLPDYLNDLNACQTFVPFLRSEGLVMDFQWKLEELCADNNDSVFSCASAEQRCDAFLLTLPEREGV